MVAVFCFGFGHSFLVDWFDNRSLATAAKVWNPPHATVIDQKEEHDRLYSGASHYEIRSADVFQKAFGDKRILVYADSDRAYYYVHQGSVTFWTYVPYDVSVGSVVSATYRPTGWVTIIGSPESLKWMISISVFLGILWLIPGAIALFILSLIWMWATDTIKEAEERREHSQRLVAAST